MTTTKASSYVSFNKLLSYLERPLCDQAEEEAREAASTKYDMECAKKEQKLLQRVVLTYKWLYLIPFPLPPCGQMNVEEAPGVKLEAQPIKKAMADITAVQILEA